MYLRVKFLTERKRNDKKELVASDETYIYKHNASMYSISDYIFQSNCMTYHIENSNGYNYRNSEVIITSVFPTYEDYVKFCSDKQICTKQLQSYFREEEIFELTRIRPAVELNIACGKTIFDFMPTLQMKEECEWERDWALNTCITFDADKNNLGNFADIVVSDDKDKKAVTEDIPVEPANLDEYKLHKIIDNSCWCRTDYNWFFANNKTLEKIKKSNKEKENKNMFNFDKIMPNLHFGKVTNDSVKMSIYGPAFYNGSEGRGEYVAYKDGSYIDASAFIFDNSENMFYEMPVAINDVKPNDYIRHSGTFARVVEILENGNLKVEKIFSNEVKEIFPVKNIFGFNFYTKLFCPFEGGFANGASTENPFGMLPMLALMDDGNFDMNKMLPLMMMSGNNPFNFGASEGAGANFDMNTLMMMMMMFNKSDD